MTPIPPRMKKTSQWIKSLDPQSIIMLLGMIIAEMDKRSDMDDVDITIHLFLSMRRQLNESTS